MLERVINDDTPFCTERNFIIGTKCQNCLSYDNTVVVVKHVLQAFVNNKYTIKLISAEAILYNYVMPAKTENCLKLSGP